MVFRPALAPGAHLTRHDTTHLRIGDGDRVVLPDSEALQALVTAIDGVRDRDVVCREAAEHSGAPPGEVAGLLDLLIARGAVVDAEPWLRLLAPRNEIASAIRRGVDPETLADRAHTVLALHAAPSCADLADLIGAAARMGGLSQRADQPPDLHVLATTGEPPRDLIESLAATGAHVLPVALSEGRCIVGPWTDLGRTPCPRCADFAQALWGCGPCGLWPSLDRPDRLHGVGVETAQAAASLIVADLLAAADGRRPATVGTRFAIGPDAHHATRLAVDFAEDCTCHLLSSVGPGSPVR
ncbi:MAG: hypothetical protein QM597_04285 [Aeromicrobium sp.]|uniref:hypothetical protein n=1 Tax=Aeromicrobium sp. TaxID=1871063 RepID=UPI0039E3455E